MRTQIVGIVLAGGRVDELSVLTAQRPKSAVPFWGMYRIIDFVLSNMMHSRIEVVGVLSQRDLFRAAASSLLQLGYDAAKQWLAKIPVRAVMSTLCQRVRLAESREQALAAGLRKRDPGDGDAG